MEDVRSRPKRQLERPTIADLRATGCALTSEKGKCRIRLCIVHTPDFSNPSFGPGTDLAACKFP